MSWYEIMMELGGRALLTLLAIDVGLLLILEITKHYGNIKNRRDRGEVSGGHSSREDTAVSASAEFDRVEVLEANTERLSPRPSVEGTRPIVAEEDLFVTNGNGSRRIDGVTLDIIHRTK